MNKTLAAFVAVATIAGSLAATPASAQRGLGAAIAGGIIGGAIVGGAVAASRPAYGGPVYVEEAPPALRLLLAAPAFLGWLRLAFPPHPDLQLIDRRHSPRLDLQTRPVLRPGFSFHRTAAIERSTASLGQQSTLRPADFW